MVRYLRIALTAAGVASGVLAVALSVRNHGMRDFLMTPVPGVNGGIEASSWQGRVSVLGRFRTAGGPFPLRFYSTPLPDMGCSDRYEFAVDLPHWNLAVAALGIECGPWIRWQFGLRTLLLGMTMASLLLGLAVTGNRNEADGSARFRNYPQVHFQTSR
jgi:hypothetical protein